MKSRVNTMQMKNNTFPVIMVQLPHALYVTILVIKNVAIQMIKIKENVVQCKMVNA